MKRIGIYTPNIQRITGKSERQSRNILNDIKVYHKKQKHQLVTVEEYSNYMGLNPNQIASFIK